HSRVSPSSYTIFMNAPAPTTLYTLSLHDALPISLDPLAWAGALERVLGDRAFAQRIARAGRDLVRREFTLERAAERTETVTRSRDRKSTRLNSSHRTISYAVFCLKKKKKQRLS